MEETLYGSSQYTLAELQRKFHVRLDSNPLPTDIKIACSDIAVLLQEASYECAMAKSNKSKAEAIFDTIRFGTEEQYWDKKVAGESPEVKYTKDGIISKGKATAYREANGSVQFAIEAYNIWEAIMKNLKYYMELTNISNIANSIEAKLRTPTTLPHNTSSIQQKDWNDN